MNQLIQSLLRPQAFPHPVTQLEVIETHISWVILTGQFAYKIKKPVDLGFLDFSTLTLRKRYCEDELRLNRRWAPDLYLGIVEIRGSEKKAAIGRYGPIIDYAVKMIQFPQSARLDAQLAAGMVDEADMRSIARMLATAHSNANVSTPHIEESINRPMQDNFDEIVRHFDSDTLQILQDWTVNELKRLKPALVHRRDHGYVRECHGDLHLGNLVRLASGITAFDCVEFSKTLRDIDVVSDVAFLVMDLVAHQRRDLAYEFLNRYLELSGDYDGIELLDLYFVYHCLIRGKVAAIRLGNRTSQAAAEEDRNNLLHELEVARRFISRSPPIIIAMHGFSGSGKTSIAGLLMRSLPAIRVRSDIERKRIYGYGETDSSESGVDQGIYSKAASNAVHEHLVGVASRIVESGHSVIVDASFLKSAHRNQLSDLANRRKAVMLIIDTKATHPVLIERIIYRSQHQSDASEANISVLNRQYSEADPLTADEWKRTISIDSESPTDPAAILLQVRKVLAQAVAEATADDGGG